MKRIKTGSRVKAREDITWSTILSYAAPPAIVDRVLVASGSFGKVKEIDRKNGLYKVEFSEKNTWWLTKESIEG